MPKPTIALDLDDTLVQFADYFIDYHNHKYGTNFSKARVRSYNIFKEFNLTFDEGFNHTYDFYAQPEFLSLPPLEGSQQALTKLSDKYLFTIITSRPTFMKDRTLRWLNTFFPEIFSEKNVILTNSFAKSKTIATKSEICQKINAHYIVEDCLEHAQSCCQNNTKAFLLDYPWNQSKSLPKNITRVKKWKEIVKKLS